MAKTSPTKTPPAQPTTKATKATNAGTKKPAAGARPAARVDTAALIARIEANARAAGVSLPKGAKASAIAAAEKKLGLSLPDEVKAFYQAHDGGGDAYVVENRELLSLSRIVSEWRVWKDLFDKGTFGDNDHGEPGRGVQQRWWIPEWVPVTYDGSGNHHVVDLAPGPKGAHGQVLSFWHDDSPRRVVGKGFLEWLAAAEWTAD